MVYNVNFTHDIKNMKIVSDFCVISRFGISCIQRKWLTSTNFSCILCALVIKFLQRDFHDLPDCIRDIDVNYLLD